MKKKWIIGLLILLIALVLLAGAQLFRRNVAPAPADTGTPDVVAVSIDASKKTAMPFLFRPGIWLQDNPNYKYILGKFVSENAVGKIQLEIGNELAGSKSFADFQAALKEKYAPGTVFRDGIEEAKKTGETLIIGQWPAKMPEWLSSRTGDNRPYSNTGFAVRSAAPPKCFGEKCHSMADMACSNDACSTLTAQQLATDGLVVGWEGVVNYTVRFFREDLGVKNLGYYFGHEQNKDWMGSEDDFYKTYAATARGVKNVDQNIPVGGAGPWYYAASRLKCDLDFFNQTGFDICRNTSGWTAANSENPLNLNFLEYAGRKKLPVDFLNYHMFGEVPMATVLETMGDDLRGWLKDSGYSEQTPLFPGDWTVWSNGYPADYIDTEYNAAYVINMLYQMDRAGIAWQGHDFNVTDGGRLESRIIQARGQDVQFIGDWPMFTNAKVIKPVYNSFKALSLLYGKEEGAPADRIPAEAADDFLSMLASETKDGKTVRILLSNFVPAGKESLNLMLTLFDKYLASRNYDKDQADRIKDLLQPKVRAAFGDGQAIDVGKLRNIFRATDFSSVSGGAKVKEDLIAYSSSMQTMLDRWGIYKTKKRQVNLTIENLPFSGQAKLSVYRIDKDHANACRYNKRTEAAPTQTECGVNGQIDRSVAQVRQATHEQGIKVGRGYLESLGYTAPELSNIQREILPCIGDASAMSCFDRRSDAFCREYPSRDCARLKTDLLDAYKRAEEAGDDLLYYGRHGDLQVPVWVDQINSSSDVSLEGSRETREIAVENGEFRDTILMEPYGVALLEIRQ